MSEPRTSPLVSQLALWIAFAIVVAVSIFTVLVPELQNDKHEPEQGRRSQHATD